MEKVKLELPRTLYSAILDYRDEHKRQASQTFDIVRYQKAVIELLSEVSKLPEASLRNLP